MLHWVRLLSLFALAGLVASPAAAVTIIDLFDEPPGGQSVTLTNPNAGDVSPNSVVTGLAGVAGGSRGLQLTAQDVFAGGSQASAEVNLDTSPGNFQLTNSIRIDSLVRITWDGDGAGLNLDLSSLSDIVLQGVENDLSTTYKVVVSTDGGGSSELTLSPGAGFSGDLVFEFSSLVGSVDFADIDSIVLEIDGARGADVIIDAVVSTPEPTTAAALGLGLLGLGWLGRRRARA